MKLTVVYDNEVKREGLWRGYGFSCFIEAEKMPSVLFNAGGDSPTLLHNMKELNIDPKDIGIIVISHAHGDHAGGLSGILELNETAELYLPSSFGRVRLGGRIITVKAAIQICEDVFSTGELMGIEQSLALKTDKGVSVVTGCSHPGVANILKAASEFGKIYGILGGFHGFREFKALESLSLIYPCHCTAYKREIRDLYPDRALECGAGLVVEL
ncbi:MAG: MBL fold metallo-hydrolase [Dehalococcoidia bacterium]|nr:MAG: MBL fold metallo-hydrolase [Dehalococcoidia bacterium]